MASDEEEILTGTSYISALTLKVKNMLKKPTLDSQLSETLDSFITELSINDHYLANGIVNIKFAEAGLFLESSANLYGKRVDVLWDNAVQYQMQLCTYNKSQKENAKEAEKITQRINRNKKKKVTQDVVEKLPFYDELVNDISESSKVLNAWSSLTSCDRLNITWRDTNKNKTVDNNSSTESFRQHDNQTIQRSPCSSFLCNVNQGVSLDSGEKLASHYDLVVYRLLPYIGSFYNVMEPGRIQGGNNQDWVLQKYLKHVGVTCKKFWLQRLGDDFNLFQKRIYEIDTLLLSETNVVGLSSLSFVNVLRLPPELLVEYTKNNDIHLRPMIHDLLVKERQNSAGRIKKSSERFSEADSAYYEMFNDGDSRSTSRPDTNFTSQHSFVDSGIYDDQVPSVSSCHVFDLDVANEETVLRAENSLRDENVLEAMECSSRTLCDTSSNLVQAIENIPTISDITAVNNSIGDDSVPVVNPETVCSDNNYSSNSGGDTEIDESICNLTAAANNISSALGTESSGYISGISELDLTTLSSNVEKTHNKTIPTEDNSKVSSINITSTPVPVTLYNSIQPWSEKSSKTPKRKKITSFNDDELPIMTKRKCIIRSRWLKTVITSSHIFESFYASHYIAEDGEEGQAMYEDEDAYDTQYDLVPHTILSSDVDVNSEVNNSSSLHNNIRLINDTVTQNLNGTDDVPVSQCLVAPITQLAESVNLPESNDVSNISDNAVYASNCEHASDSYTFSRIKAVSDWRSFIEPKLKELHKSEFDIHHYGSKIMNSISEGETLSFNNLVGNEKSVEVCRYFLASLQLANTYNIELSAPQGQLANEGFNVKLLTKERYHEHLAEYEAPSENAFREKLARAQAACPSHLLHSTPKISNKKSRKRLKL